MGIILKSIQTEKEMEYDEFFVKVRRMEDLDESMRPYYFLYGKRKELFREIWDVIDASWNENKMLDRLEKLEEMLKEQKIQQEERQVEQACQS